MTRRRAILLALLATTCLLASGRPPIAWLETIHFRYRLLPLENALLAMAALFGSWLYVLSTLALGDAVLRQLEVVASGYALAVKIVVGAALLSAAVTVLSLTHLAFPPLVALLGFLPLALYWRPTLLAESLRLAPGKVAPSRWQTKAWWILISPYVAYVLLNCITNPTGPDLGIYHLVIPRDVLRDHGLWYNAFSHAAGLQFGWHHYGIPAYLVGGERGYLCLSFFAYLGLLWVTCAIVRDVLGDASHPWAAAACFVVSFVLCGMSGASISNNDVPLLFIEVVAVLLAVHPTLVGDRARPWPLGLVMGFLLSVKVTALPSAVLLGLLFLWRTRPPRIHAVLRLLAVVLPLAGVWPAVAFFATGSPLPFFMLALRTQGPPPPSVTESFAQMLRYFGVWYAENFRRFFTGPMSGYGILLAGVAIGLVRREFRTSKLVLGLLAFGLARYGLFNLASGKLDPVVLFHDRYHMLSYLCLALAGFAGWVLAFGPVLRRARPALAPSLLLLGAAAIEIHQLRHGYRLYFPTPPDYRSTAVKIPSLLDQLVTLKDDFRREPGTQYGPTLYWMAKNLPSDAVVAGTAISPYGAGRRYLQILPVSQDQIDLTLPPETILARLRALGVTHLHLTLYTGLPQWCVPEMWKWLQTTGQIPGLPGVRQLRSQTHEGEEIEAVFDIRADTEIGRSGPSFYPPLDPTVHR